MTLRASSQIIPIKPIELVDAKYDQFIGTYEDHVPKFICDRLIQTLDKYVDTDASSGDYRSEEVVLMDGTKQFPDKVLGRKDKSILLQYADAILHSEVNQYLQACYLHYVEQYGFVGQKLISFDQKLQRTEPGGGYHHWHCENSTWEMAQRSLVWAIYLNDEFEAGETEFLHQHIRVKPKRGTVVIWPAAWPWQHRGNPPINGTKYILTGWYINCPI
jgi:hypothetical protein